MKIERLYIYDFGSLTNKLIEFDPSRINLLIEEDGGGQSSVLAALTASLYATPARERGHLGIELELPGESDRVKIRIVRDFEHGHARVFNLSEGGKEITDQFTPQNGGAGIGPALLGLFPEQFVNTCYVEQGELDALPDPGQLTEHLRCLADTVSGQRTAADAIRALRHAMTDFPGLLPGKETQSISDEIQRTKGVLTHLEEELEKQKAQQDALLPALDRRRQLQQQLEEMEKNRITAVYLKTRAQLAQAKRASGQRQELEKQQRELEVELKKLESYQTAPAPLADLEQWRSQWNELYRSLQENEQALRQAEQELEKIRRRIGPLSCLEGFTRHDFEILSQAAPTYERVQTELKRLEKEAGAPMKELAEKGIDLDEFAKFDQRLRTLTPEQREEAIKAPEKIAHLEDERDKHENKLIRQTSILEQIDKERKQRQEWSRVLLLAALVVTLLGLILYFLQSSSIAGLFLVLALIALSLGLYCRRAAKTYRGQELEQADQEVAQTRQDAQQARQELEQYNDEMRFLAYSIDFLYVGELAQACQYYNQVASELQPHLNVRARLNELRQEMEQLTQTVKQYYQKAGLEKVDVSKSTIEGFKNDVEQFLKLSEVQKPIEEETAALREEVEKQRHQSDELMARIENALESTALSKSGNMDVMLQQIKQEMGKYHRFRQIQSELLPSIQQALNDPAVWEASSVQREQLEQQLQKLAEEHPTLTSLSPTKTAAEYAAEAEQLQQRIDRSQAELTSLTQQLADDLKQRDQHQPELLEQHHRLSRHLRRVQDFKASVELAMETLERLALENHRQWAEALTTLSQEFLNPLNTEYTALQFDPNLNLTISMKGRPEPLPGDQIQSQLSTSAREQLILLLRLIVSRYLTAHRLRLPLILDEPLAGSDETRLMPLMLTLDQLSRQHQVILVSRQPHRHQWLKSKLPHLFTERVHQCRLADLSQA